MKPAIRIVLIVLAVIAVLLGSSNLFLLNVMPDGIISGKNTIRIYRRSVV